MYLSFDLKTASGYIKNPDTCQKATLDILKHQVLEAFKKLHILHLELVRKNISFKEIASELFEDYKMLLELKFIIENN